MPIGGEAAWRGPDMARRSSEWIVQLSPAEVAELQGAARHLAASGVQDTDATQADFPLPSLGLRLRALVKQIDGGRGFALVRGVPVQDLSESDVKRMYWGIGLHLGVVLPQSAPGDLIGDVRSKGHSIQSTLRGYQSSDDLGFHTDACDVVALLCRQRAKSGGASRIASSVAIHDHIVLNRPDIALALYEAMPFKWLEYDAAVQNPWFTTPVFSMFRGHFASRYAYLRCLATQDIPGAPMISPAQRQGLDLVRDLANDPAFYLDMDFQPGDLQLVVNYQIYHARTSFEDRDEVPLKRHVLRMWMATPTGRPLHPGWQEAYGGVSSPACVRGGVPAWHFPERYGAYRRRQAAALGMRNPLPQG
jgi:hypothetical protein